MNAKAYDGMLLAVDLRVAIDDEQFELHFQPQARLSDRWYVGMEALLRWQHPVRGSVRSSHFIPVAEASGPIVDLWRRLARFGHDGTQRAWHRLQ